MRYTIVIVRPTGYRFSDCFKEVSETLMYGLHSLGYDAQILENSIQRKSRHIFIGCHMLTPDMNLPSDSILYNFEQVSCGDIGHLESLAKKYTLWDYARPNVSEWATKGIEAKHVPMGYVSEMTRIPQKTEDIDVLFYGSMNERRRDVIDKLRSAGLHVIVCVNSCYGETLNRVMARAKVILNVHYFASQIFEITRVGYALANKKAVVSEESADDYPQLKNGLHIVPYDSIVEACKLLIECHELRNTIANNGFRLFSQMKESAILEAALT